MKSLLLALLIPSLAWAGEWQIDTSHSAAQFSVRHLMVSNVRGEFGKITGTVNYDAKDVSKSTVNVSIDVASISTRDEKRDAHLKSADFFDVEKYPTMTFVSKKVQSTGGKLKITGDLTLHGVTKEVVLTAEPLSKELKDPWGNTKTGTTATAKINRKDFGLAWNKALEAGGVAVGEEVNILIDVELNAVPAKK